MERTLGQDSTSTSGSVDKSRILYIKPLRCLISVFPSSANFVAPFVYIPPSGPFSSVFAPFYPFPGSSDSENIQTPFSVPNQQFGFASPISTAVPINSYRTAYGDARASGRKSRGCAQSQSHSGIAEEDGFSDDHDQGTQYSSRGRKIKMRAKGGHSVARISIVLHLMETVENLLLINNLFRRKISQIEDSKEATPGVTKRPDLRSAAILTNKGICTNARKRAGAVPGVEIGDIFYFRMEMCLIGLHAPTMAGIDCMVLKMAQNEEPVAVSIVSSGGYVDNVEDGDVLIYSSQGGNLNMRGKTYVYDGLYKVRESWVDKTKAGCNDGITTRAGIILPDLTSGAESLPVSLVNDVDDEKGSAHFTYSPILKFAKPVSSVEPSAGCTCHNGCHPGGLKVRLEVFKSKDKGWGLRSWDPIDAGDYICEYAGEAVDTPRAKELGDENNNCYIFYSTHTYHSVGVLPGESNEASKIPFPLIISAKVIGNVARFMNHGCSPNVLWQAVLRANNRESDIHIMFFAIKNIPPMTELTYDYGMVPPDKVEQGKKRCLCGSLKCRGYFY
ncbi:hypothetical protein SLEP1_g37970 [Rubroshorea leprosula]|uniref:Uncharacterized protein n=1 Tax=Rubroshorea leprosula TaxID=152421 RepID=A0AAV5KWD8_9ROSI|nr:hypothetical protein SLEP1_g37970 [Rubroshorea leprosula]